MKIAEYLKEHDVQFESHEHIPAYTAQEIAAEEHVSGSRLAKAVVVKGSKGFAMCVLPACCKLDLEKVAKSLKEKTVRLADENEMAELFKDAEVGAEPPFGNLYDLPTLVDLRLSKEDRIVFQAGSHREAICMNYCDYAKLVSPSIADLAIHL
ncbi:MAG: YbaK/EbsC family protein [Planctomycetaceae bacterium]|nr:MAG: YbaK/EbsC family protein [Planctomycetaceae bacterium]